MVIHPSIHPSTLPACLALDGSGCGSGELYPRPHNDNGPGPAGSPVLHSTSVGESRSGPAQLSVAWVTGILRSSFIEVQVIIILGSVLAAGDLQEHRLGKDLVTNPRGESLGRKRHSSICPKGTHSCKHTHTQSGERVTDQCRRPGLTKLEK